jgi:hypothetical protein
MRCAHDIERTIEFEDPSLISAFIGEPIMQGMGALAAPPEYWPIVREICSKYDILLIVDEVICGFGRTGKMFATEHIDVQPDLLTMAKGISSGYIPLGAVGCTDKVMEPIAHFMHLHTYGNHPVACAAGLKRRIVGLPDGMARMQARLMDFVPGKPFSTDNYLSLQVDNVSIENCLWRYGIEPRSIENTVPFYLGGSKHQLDLDRCRQRRDE